MDRNDFFNAFGVRYRVALRKESVDRNALHPFICPVSRVALRKESVDRNTGLTARNCGTASVALRKESVDRNVFKDAGGTESVCRSPQGERG